MVVTFNCFIFCRHNHYLLKVIPKAAKLQIGQKTTRNQRNETMYNLLIKSKSNSDVDTVEIDSGVIPRTGEQFFIDDELVANHCGGMKNFLVIEVSHSLNYKHNKVTPTVTIVPVSSTEDGIPEKRTELLQEFGWLNKA